MVVSGKTKLSLQPWPDYTEEKHILLNTDSLLTVAEPCPKLRELYLSKIGLTEDDLKKDPPKELLTEGEELPDYDDDYEPRYEEV